MEGNSGKEVLVIIRIIFIFKIGPLNQEVPHRRHVGATRSINSRERHQPDAP